MPAWTKLSCQTIHLFKSEHNGALVLNERMQHVFERLLDFLSLPDCNDKRPYLLYCLRQFYMSPQF
ncbi:hypothetical protein CW304_04725 [Bacillus sp. UFRGS-B20]|nr:hypothetical protein CW304_04725 [Bacillus sp. UFRGS-B20]